MLSITVKTMDSQSRQYEVEESTTIRDFKEKIHQEVNIPSNRQRLIFQGRVLQDDFVLTSEHHGKVLHLVQRIPVDTTTVASASSSTTITSSTAQTTSTASGTGANMFNPAQLSQMIFQQAMGGLGNLMNGSSIRGNMGVNPNNPLEHMVNFQIDVNQGNINQTQGRPSFSGGATATSSARTQNQRSQSNHPRHSIPRQQLIVVQRIFAQLNAVLGHLERDSAPEDQVPTTAQEGSDVDHSGDVFANETFEQLDEEANVMDTSTDAASSINAPTTQTQATQTRSSTAPTPGQVPTCHNHPSLGELGSYFTLMLDAQRRLEPFINQTIVFLNTDPPFDSTRSPEFRSTSRMLSHTLQAQQMLAEIQRLLSRVVIPLGRTPPRTMLVPGPAGVTRPPSGSRGIGHVAQGVRPPAFGHPRPNFPGFGFGIPPGTEGMQPRVVPVAHGVQMRLRFPQPGGNVASSSNPASGAGPTPVSSTGNRPTTTSAPSTASQPGSTSEMRTTHFNVGPPAYTVQVNATIEPRVHIHVGAGSSDNGPANEAESSIPTNSSDRQQTANPNTQPQARTNNGTNPAGNTQQGTGILPNLPNIPGVPQEVFSNIFQSVARSAQQQWFGNQRQQQTPSAGLIVVQGPPGGPNQINDDVSNILGQTVYNAVYNELSRSNQPRTLASTTVPNVTFVSSSSGPTHAATSTTASSGSSSSTSTNLPQSSSSTDPVSMETCNGGSSSESLKQDPGDAEKDAAEGSSSAVDLVSGGSFGSLPAPESDAASVGLLTDSSPADRAQMMDIIRSEVPRQPTAEAHSSRSQSGFLSEEASSVVFNRALQNMSSSIGMSMDRPANQFARQLGFVLPERNRENCAMSARIFYEMGEELTGTEILGACQDNPAPLNRVRGRLQLLISSEYFSGTAPTSVQQIETVAHVLSEVVREHVVEFFSGARVVPDVDIVESNLSLLRHSFKKAMEILFLADDATFAVDMNKHVRYVISLWVGLNENLLRGGRNQLVKLFKDYKPFQSESSAAVLLVIEQVYASKAAEGGSPFAAFLRHLTTLSPVTQEEIDQFVLSEAPQKVESDPGSPETGDEEHFEDAMETSPSNQPLPSSGEISSAAGPSTGPVPSSSTTEEKKGSGDNWKKEVPAEWVDTIVSDAEKQKKMDPQMPYSDAYVVGMPASKRRKVVS